MAQAASLIVALWFGSALSDITINLTVDEENVDKFLIGNIMMQAQLNISSTPVGNLTFFSILTSPYSDLFAIESNGDLFAVKKINREGICQRQLTCIIAIDVAVKEGIRLTIIRVEITVKDINNNYPAFSLSTCALAISEGTATGTSYELPSATDLDVGINSIQRFILEPEGTSFGLEAHQNLDGTWALNLVLNLTLDRETWSSYNLTVKAIDAGQPSLTGLLTINVTVLDVNDNRPVFSQTDYSATIEEDVAILTEIVTVVATDRDAGDNGRVSYYFANTELNPVANFVGIEEDIGKIFIKERLNSQTGPLIVLFVEGRDHGEPIKKSIQCKVTITVINKNDNAPDIHINLLGNVTENSMTGTPVALIQVTDTDTGLNGEAVCSCNNSNFTIHSVSTNKFRLDVGLAIDREVVEKYIIMINCSDKGEPSLSSNKYFVLWVQDENDNTPEFSQSFYATTVQENNEVGAVVLRVIATDRDIEKNNSRIRYHVESFQYSSSFLIDQDTGIVKAIKSFDYEQNNFYVFNVTATDYGQPSLSNKITVFINITDLNDNMPKFSGDSYAMSVLENANIGKIIGQVTATDKDSGNNGKVSYMIPAEYRYMPFKVLVNGTVIMTEIVDRECNSSFQFAIVASDFGAPPLAVTVLVYVTILDQNDNKPIFKFPNDNNNTISVHDDMNLNAVIATAIAHDADEKNNSLLTYNISDGNIDDLFSIDPSSGAIHLKRRFLVGDIKLFLLNLSARDHGEIPFETLTTLQVDFSVAMTLPEMDRVHSKSHNILITIVISCMTFVLSVIIIMVICVVSKKGIAKHLHDHDEQKIISHRNSNRSTSSRGSSDKMLCANESVDLENRYQNTRKRESHDIDVSMEPDRPYDLTSTFKVSSPVTSQSNETPPSQSQKKNDSRQPQDLQRMTSFDVEQVISHGQTNSSNNDNIRHWPKSPQEEIAMTYTGLTRKGNQSQDDSHSDLSGETITNDSGRGGSVEDIHIDWRSPNTSLSHACYFSENHQPNFTSFHGSSLHKPGPILTSYLNRKQHIYNYTDVATPLNDLSHPSRNNIYSQQKPISKSSISPQILTINGGQALLTSFNLVQNNMDHSAPLCSSERSDSNIPRQLNHENVSNHNGNITGHSQEDDETSSTSGSYIISDPWHDVLQSEVCQDSVLELDTKNKKFYKQDTFV